MTDWLEQGWDSRNGHLADCAVHSCSSHEESGLEIREDRVDVSEMLGRLDVIRYRRGHCTAHFDNSTSFLPCLQIRKMNWTNADVQEAPLRTAQRRQEIFGHGRILVRLIAALHQLRVRASHRVRNLQKPALPAQRVTQEPREYLGVPELRQETAVGWDRHGLGCPWPKVWSVHMK